jgi:hypothetical protein
MVHIEVAIMFIRHYVMDSQDDMKRYAAVFPASEIPVTKTLEILRWCHKTFGKPGYCPLTVEARWEEHARYGEVIFYRESDLIMFLLRWE